MATTNEKRCSKCDTHKALDAFGKNRQTCDGLHTWCKQCCKESRGLQDKDKRSEYQRAYREANKAKLAEYRRANAAQKAEYNRAYKPKKNEWIKNRRQTDPSFRIAYALRTRLYDGIVRKYKASKSASTATLLGMDAEMTRHWLEFQFEPGMSWANYGTDWEIDHVLPLSRFDLTDPDQQRIACGWTNLQPKHKVHNRSKGSQIVLHDFFNTLVSAHRFIQKQGLGRQEYQALRESLAWLRATI